MRLLPIAAISLLLAFLAPAVGATHAADSCPTYSTMGIGGVGLLSTEVGTTPGLQFYVAAAKGSFYIVNDALLTGDWISSLWIYQEANGDGGLQRHDEFCHTPGYDDGTRPPDVIVW